MALPDSIGAFRMMNWELTKNGTWVHRVIPRIKCQKEFGDEINTKKMRSPYCFDLSDRNANIGRAEIGQVGVNALEINLVKCDKNEPGFED